MRASHALRRICPAWPLAVLALACSDRVADTTRGIRGADALGGRSSGVNEFASGQPSAGAPNAASGGGAVGPGGGAGGARAVTSAEQPSSASGGGAPAGAAVTLGGSGGVMSAAAGTAASANVAGAPAGAAGLNGTSSCHFSVEYAASAAIGTVELVTWSSDLPALIEAHIDFGAAGEAPTWRAPVDLAAPNHRTALLGMKGGKPYTFRIVATGAAETCTSADYSFTTGTVPDAVPKIARSDVSAGASRGFIVTSLGVGAPSANPMVFIFDTDGDVVWWTAAPPLTSRAHLSWDAKTMWMLALDLDGTSGDLSRVSIDGLETQNAVPGLEKSHHDFAVLPDGGLATMVWKAGDDGPNAFVELKADGSVVTLIPDLGALYQADAFHPNAVHYYPADDSFTLSDRNVNAFVKFRHDGELVWQLGGANGKGRTFALAGLTPWQINHGHHLTPDGHFIFFNNGQTNEASRVIDVVLDQTNFTATKTWEYRAQGIDSAVLGDVERLANGNVFVTFSDAGVMQEVDAAGNVVQTFRSSAGSFGYADFRTSLYGPPPR